MVGTGWRVVAGAAAMTVELQTTDAGMSTIVSAGGCYEATLQADGYSRPGLQMSRLFAK